MLRNIENLIFLNKKYHSQNMFKLYIYNYTKLLIMIQRILKSSLRKDIPRKNKKINHKAYVSSMFLSQKVPYIIKYHKKKTIAAILCLIIIYTYDLQKRIIFL